MNSVRSIKKTGGFLFIIERWGNRIPSVTILIIGALVLCGLLSLGLSYIRFDYVHPVTKVPIQINNMLSANELITLLTLLVKNFVNFPPLGVTLVATLGIALAESSGFLSAVMKKLLSITSPKILTPAIVFVGIISHAAADSAYLFLMPMSAMMFYAYGRHPLAGIAAAFAGLSGAFTASYIPSILDPLMQGFTQGAAQLIDRGYQVNVLSNYFVSIGGTFSVIAVAWFITDRWVEPRLWQTLPLGKEIELDEKEHASLTKQELKAFRWAIFALLALIALFSALLIPQNSLFRSPDGQLTSAQAPIMQSVVPLLFIVFAVPGLVYGIIAKTFTRSRQVIEAMEKTLITLIPFVVFSFFCAQFLYVFGRSQLGTLLAVSGAELLTTLALPSWLSILAVIILTGFLNLFITSASSKWAILAPILVPMLMTVGIAPELTQAAFRVSDSAVNIVTPMFPFYPLIIFYCQRYCPQAGVGSLCSMMLPYTLGLLFALTATLYLFWFFDIPLGFQSQYYWSAPTQ